MSERPSKSSSFGPRRLLGLLALKIVLLVFAVLVTLRLYGLL